MSGVGSIGYTGNPNSKKLLKYYTSWTNGMEKMFGFLSPKKLKYNYKSEYEKAVRAAQKNMTGEMDKRIKKCNIYHLFLTRKPLPEEKKIKVLGNLSDYQRWYMMATMAAEKDNEIEAEVYENAIKELASLEIEQQQFRLPDYV